MALEHHTIVRLLLAERAKLHAYIWSIVRDDHVTEDVFQDVSILAIDKRQEIDDEAHLHRWLRTAARFESLKALRGLKRRPTAMDAATLDLIDRQWSEYDAMPSSDLTEALRCCLDELTPHARRIVRARYVDGVSGKQLAERLNQKAHSLYVTMGRIHRRLHDCIQKRLRDGGRAVPGDLT